MAVRAGEALPLPPCIIAVVGAPWATPSAPAPVVIQELQRRWGEDALGIILDGEDDDVLEQLEIDLLPTWIRWEPADGAQLADGRTAPSAAVAEDSALAAPDGPLAAAAADEGGAEGSEPVVPVDAAVAEHARVLTRDLAGIRGVLADGRPVRIQGTWRETVRIEGALPKLDVQARLMELREG